MTSRFLAAVLTFSLVLGLAGVAAADEPAKTPPSPDTPSTSGEPGKAGDPKAADPSSSSSSTTKPEATKGKPKIEKATFASGCFWCGEAVFEQLKGVKDVVSGYTGGNVPNPTYEMVST